MGTRTPKLSSNSKDKKKNVDKFIKSGGRKGALSDFNKILKKAVGAKK